jgi:chemotaxis protein histidine kinase CheA
MSRRGYVITGDDALLDPYQYFRVEARELLEQLGQGALELDKGDTAPDLIARMLRSAHTLKRDAARAVSLGAAQMILPLDQIGAKIAQLLGAANGERHER